MRQLSEKYNELYFENIEKFGKEIINALNVDQYFVDFYPSIGTDTKNSDFLIYGQAVYGWSSGFLCSQTFKKDVKDSIKASNEFIDHKSPKIPNSPINWVNARWSKSVFNSLSEEQKTYYSGTYWCYRSFFWNVVHKLISDYYDFERQSWQWTNKIVWSDLYKIAPEESNPSKWHRTLQLKKSIELIKAEISEINPKYCIVLTNDKWWKPFRENLNTTVLKTDLNKQIESVENYNGTKIIVTSRPYMGSSENWINEIKKFLV